MPFEKEKDASFYKNYISFLNSHLIDIENLRVSIAFPGDKNLKGKFDFINNYEYGDKLKEVILNLIDYPEDCKIINDLKSCLRDPAWVSLIYKAYI